MPTVPNKCLVILLYSLLFISAYFAIVGADVPEQSRESGAKPPSTPTNKTASISNVTLTTQPTVNKTEQITEKSSFDSSGHNDDIPNSFRVGFYVFMGLGLIAIFFFTYRSYKMRLSRAERRYGVQGERGTQELTPLPISIEEDSDNEDHTLFEINKQQTRFS